MSMPKAGLRKFAVKLGPYFFSFLFFFFLLVMKSPYNLKYTWQIILFYLMACFCLLLGFLLSPLMAQTIAKTDPKRCRMLTEELNFSTI